MKMPKRFMDTGIWERPWFMELGPAGELFAIQRRWE